LLAQVRQGIGNCDTAGDDFPVDGTRHLFSTLRPEPGDGGALRLTALHRHIVNAAVFLIVAMVGLVLAAYPAGTRLWWLAALIVAVVLAAVFAPTLAQALLDLPLYLAIALVLIVWSARGLAWFIPGCVTYCSSSFRKAATATAVAAAATTAAPASVPAAPSAPSAAPEGSLVGQPPPPLPQGQEGGQANG
jgi:hypothetical protein